MGVTGIGGVFIRARDPQALARWYAEHLDVGSGEYGQWPQQAGNAVFAPFPEDSGYFPPDRRFMLNLRVDDLEALLASLRAAGVAVERDPASDTPEIGRFARIHDPEGNPIELWEPPITE